jgi:outer membrane protein
MQTTLKSFIMPLIILVTMLICAIVPWRVDAGELPLWEAGFGLTGLSLPDYRGSDEQRGYILPLPYVVYRGETLRMDKKGIYGILFHSERVHLNVSADGSVPVTSDKNSARRGMPNLDPTGQIGPSLELCISARCDTDTIVQVRLPVRAVFASDFSYLNGIGFVTNPQLNFDFNNLETADRWNFGFAFGPLYATRQFHAYYYEVAPQFAVPGVRSSYNARGGYSGLLVTAALSKRFENYWFGTFVRYDNLSGAVFADSPLVKTKQTIMAGFGVAWVFGQSPILVNAIP